MEKNISDSNNDVSQAMEVDETTKQLEHMKYRKLFVGKLDPKTTNEDLKSYFKKFGEIMFTVVVPVEKDKSLTYGFVTFNNSEAIDKVQATRPHKVLNKTVKTRRAIPVEDTASKEKAKVLNKKLFIGGVKKLEQNDIFSYFKNFGNISTVTMVKNKDTAKRRGFAFIEFDDFDPVDKIMLNDDQHFIKGVNVKVMRAEPPVLVVRKPQPPKTNPERRKRREAAAARAAAAAAGTART